MSILLRTLVINSGFESSKRLCNLGDDDIRNIDRDDNNNVHDKIDKVVSYF